MIWPESWVPSPPAALLLLLLAGHLLADFLVQTRDDVDAKAQGYGYLSHGTKVLLTHLVVLLPMLSPGVVAIVVGIAVLHLVIDRVKAAMASAGWSRLRAFLLDQLAHLSVILVAWGALIRIDAVPGFRWLSGPQMGAYVGGAVLLAAFVFNATGGSELVRGILGMLPDDGEGVPGPAGYEGAGRTIGMLERTLLLPMVLYGAWGAMMLLVAAKSIARFEELKVRRFAEYYLVGTLTSLLVALGIGLFLGRILAPLLLM